MDAMTSRSKLLLVVPAVVAALTLTGCSVVDNVVDGAVGTAQEELGNGIRDTVDQALGGVGVTTNGELPPGFPTEDVPTITAGLVGGGSAPENGGWVVQYTLDDIAQLEEAGTLLADAGYTQVMQNVDATSGIGIYTGAYNVMLVASAEGDGTTMRYLVTPGTGQ